MSESETDDTSNGQEYNFNINSVLHSYRFCMYLNYGGSKDNLKKNPKRKRMKTTTTKKNSDL